MCAQKEFATRAWCAQLEVGPPKLLGKLVADAMAAPSGPPLKLIGAFAADDFFWGQPAPASVRLSLTHLSSSTFV